MSYYSPAVIWSEPKTQKSGCSVCFCRLNLCHHVHIAITSTLTSVSLKPLDALKRCRVKRQEQVFKTKHYVFRVVFVPNIKIETIKLRMSYSICGGLEKQTLTGWWISSSWGEHEGLWSVLQSWCQHLYKFNIWKQHTDHSEPYFCGRKEFWWNQSSQIQKQYSRREQG